MDSIPNKIQGNLVVYLVAMAAVFVILFGIRASATIINPIMLAIVITITVLPVPGRLKKRGMPGWLALVLSILLVVLILLMVIFTVFFSITKLTTTLPTYMNDLSTQATSDLSTLDDSGSMTIQIQSVVTTMGSITASLLASTASLLVQFGLALVIFCFMIAAALSLPAPSRLGLDPNAPVISRIATLTEDVRKYMTVLTGINFLVGLGNTVFLLIIGVDYAVLWGLLAWFMGYIPSIGFLIALIPPTLLAYAEFGPQTALIVIAGYILINGGVQNIVQPKIMGQSLRISPVVVFIMVFVWGYLLGGMGAILAVPMTLLVLIIMEYFDGTRPIAILMRYTGEENKEERQAAAVQVKGLVGKAKGAIRSVHGLVNLQDNENTNIDQK
jgi:AI-2 transport protein TqsA